MAEKEKKINDRITVLNTALNRVNLAWKLGISYGGDRDLYKVLGHPQQISYMDYRVKFDRLAIANAIISKPPKASWRGGVKLFESDEERDTLLEKEWKKLWKNLGLHFKFVRLDKLSRLGKYAVLLLGLDDVTKKEDFLNPVQGSNRKLLYTAPYSENDAVISQWETDPNSERYGKPKVYDITISHPGISRSEIIRVHHSRIIHVVEDPVESEVLGRPTLKAVFNNLIDIEKIVGGSAEMFWRGARPGYQGKVDPNYTLTSDSKEALEDQLQEFEHNLRRFLINEGVDIEALQTQVADPSSHINVQLDQISIYTGIPKRILLGSERGELASTEDKNQWASLITQRREEFLEPAILVPFVNKGIEFGFLPQPEKEDEYSFIWEDLFAPGEKEKAEVGKIRSDALSAYIKNPQAQEVVPPSAYLQYFLGLSDEQVEQIEAVKNQDMLDEQNEIEEDEGNE